MIPGILLVIPLYITLAKWGLLNTRLGLILIYTGLNTSFVIWMMQSFLAEIPRDIEEAAMVDGDSPADRAVAGRDPAGRAGPGRDRDLQRHRDVQRLPDRALADIDARTRRRCRSASRP